MRQSIAKSRLDDIINDLPSNFQDVEIIKKLSHYNDDNINYKIRSNGDCYVLKIYSPAKNPYETEQCLDAQAFFYEKGLSCQKPILINDKFLINKNNSYYSIYSFINGEPMEEFRDVDVFNTLELLSFFYTLAEQYKGDISMKKLQIPPIEKGKYKRISINLLKKYESLSKKTMKYQQGIIHGDFHLNQLLKSSDNKIFLLDFEHLTVGTSLEDIANFLFYFKCTMQNKNIPSQEIIDYFNKRNTNRKLNMGQVKTCIKQIALRYCMGRIWEFNHSLIHEKEIKKSLKTLNRANTFRT